MGVTCWSEAERSQSVGCAEDLSLYKCAAALGINLFFWKGTTVDTLVYQYLNLLVGESKSSYNGSLSFNQPCECDCASSAA